MCAYATTQLDAPTPRRATLEIGAASQSVQAWMNGQPLTEHMVTVAPTPQRWPIQLQVGVNQLLLKVCKQTGDWYFTGKYPTPGGYRVVNQAYLNYFEKSEGRSY
jgi:hypothetical protein